MPCNRGSLHIAGSRWGQAQGAMRMAMRCPSSTNRNAEIAPISTQPSGWPRDWPPPASALLCDTLSIAVVVPPWIQTQSRAPQYATNLCYRTLAPRQFTRAAVAKQRALSLIAGRGYILRSGFRREFVRSAWRARPRPPALPHRSWRAAPRCMTSRPTSVSRTSPSSLSR